MADTFEDFCKRDIEPLIEQIKTKLRERGTESNYLFMIAEKIPATNDAVSYVEYSIDEGGPLEPFGKLLEEGQWADDVVITDIPDKLN